MVCVIQDINKLCLTNQELYQCLKQLTEMKGAAMIELVVVNVSKHIVYLVGIIIHHQLPPGTTITVTIQDVLYLLCFRCKAQTPGQGSEQIPTGKTSSEIGHNKNQQVSCHLSSRCFASFVYQNDKCDI